VYKRPLSLALSAAALTGCTMIPKYHRPAAPVASEWPSGPAYGKNIKSDAPALGDIAWREFFKDPQLRKLIELALENNRDLRTATLNVQLARDQYRIQRAALLPGINVTASGGRQRITPWTAGNPTTTTVTSYGVGGGVTSYELDLFGRLRSLTAHELENFFASEEARRAAQISLVAQVAIQYFTVSELDAQLAVARQTLTAVQRSYELNKQSFDAGKTSELDLATADAQVQTAQVNVLDMERQSAQAVNYLVLLVGSPLPANGVQAAPLESQKIVANLPSGLPSELLLRRPDLLQAEHTLKAANADVGAARAAFFPTISLTNTVGNSSSDLSNLFAKSGASWAFSPQLTLPIFDAGRNIAGLDAAKVIKRIEVASYEKTIQVAFREVADALAGKTSYERQLGSQEALVKAQSERYKLAEIRYRQGVENYINVLSAQQDLYSAQQALVQTRFAKASSMVTLYKTLGGGWK